VLGRVWAVLSANLSRLSVNDSRGLQGEGAQRNEEICTRKIQSSHSLFFIPQFKTQSEPRALASASCTERARERERERERERARRRGACCILLIHGNVSAVGTIPRSRCTTYVQ
jgi:hypothetical protein